MRSEIAKNILSETPQEVRDRVRQYGHDVVKQRDAEIEAIELTQLEKEHAIWVAKVTKWQRLRNENPSFSAKSGSLQGEEK